MDTKSLGKKVRTLRIAHGWNTEECAEKAGISSRYLADIELGHKTPKLETFIQILNALHASADDVLQDSLAVGYQKKSNDILKKLEPLDVTRRKQALNIFDSVIASLQDH